LYIFTPFEHFEENKSVSKLIPNNYLEVLTTIVLQIFLSAFFIGHSFPFKGACDYFYYYDSIGANFHQIEQ